MGIAGAARGAERLDGYLGAAAALLGAGARVTEGMVEVGADEVAVLLEEAADRTGVVRETGRSYMAGRPVRVSVRRRGNRYDIDDMGGAVAVAAARPDGSRRPSERSGRSAGTSGAASVAASRRPRSPGGFGRRRAIVVVLRFFTSQEVTATPEALESIPETTAAERAVADLLPIDARSEEARAALERVPLWFHTFSLNGAGVYTSGIARDHRYRLRAIPEQLSGARVLDVGTFDGFYAFLAERRGAARVVAVDNEQYVAWIRRRFEIELEPGAGFRAIAELLSSSVAYRRLDALEVDRLGETFDVIFCFGILHRVEAPLTLLRVLGECLAPAGQIILETYGVRGGQDDPCVLVHEHGDVYARDDAVYWGFSRSSLDRLGRLAGLRGFEFVDAPEIAGHPRIIGTLAKA